MEPHELKELCENANQAFRAIGSASFEMKSAEKENLKFRRSIYVVQDINKGEKLNKSNIRRIRPDLDYIQNMMMFLDLRP